MSDRFYVNLPLRIGPITVEGSEAHHLTAVRRIRPGDRVCLFNGDGKEYPAEVTATARRKVTLQVIGVEAPTRELGFRLEVAAPLPKGDRGQFLLEKLTELGVTTFVPIRSQRSIIQPGEARVEKMRRHVVEACKQCGRNVLMEVAPPADWENYCGRSDLPAARILAHPSSAALVGPASPGSWRFSGDGLAVAVGPEGGFTEAEVDKAKEYGWQLLDLGPRTLRIETAALVLTAWASLLIKAK
jgi:16S rRNA (uracil1498-N3)-methyltransferase